MCVQLKTQPGALKYVGCPSTHMPDISFYYSKYSVLSSCILNMMKCLNEVCELRLCQYTRGNVTEDTMMCSKTVTCNESKRIVIHSIEGPRVGAAASM